MKLENKLGTFSEMFAKSLLTETNANYGSNVGGVSRGPLKKDKYSPPTIEEVPSIRFQNDALHMGQPESEMDAPSNFVYPFQSVFSELVGEYVKLNELMALVKASQDMPALSVEKKKLVKLAIKQLTFAINELKSSIENIEKITI